MIRWWLAMAATAAVGVTMAQGGSDDAGRGSQTPGQKARAFRVSDFGATADGKSDAAPGIRAAIRKAIEAGPGSEVVLEAGTYRVGAALPRSYCFPIASAKRLTIRGAGAATRLVVASPDAGLFLVTQGTDVILRDFTVDYDPVPFCQGLVRRVSVSEGWFDLDVAPGYPTPDAANFVDAPEPYGKWGMIMDPTVRRIRAGTNDHFMAPRWEHQGERIWRFFTNGEHYRLGLRDMRVGDSYVQLARGYGGAILAQGCDGIRIENVTVHASPALAVGLVGNRGQILVRKLSVSFPRGSDRLLTTNADGIHCQQNRSGPIIEDCDFEGMADDAINIYAPPNVLLEKRSPTEWLVTPGCLALSGDRFQVLDPQTGTLRGEVKVVAVTPEGRAFRLILEQGLDAAVAGADHRTADTLYNLNACGAGFRIRRNRMTGNRRYGCLLRAHSGIVEGNTFTDTTGAGVVVINEPDWPEGPVPRDILIRKNRFVRGGTCRGYAEGDHGQVVVRGAKLGHGLADEPIVRNVTISDNVFEGYLGLALFAAAVDGLKITGNRFDGAGVERVRSGPVMLFERARGIALESNRVRDTRDGITVAIEIGAGVAPGEAGIRLRSLTSVLAEGRSAIGDRRVRQTAP